MKKLLLLLIFAPICLKAQLYFPPVAGAWDTMSPSELGWCQDSIDKLYDYLETTNTDAFIVLKDGKIVLEKYFGSFGQNSPHAWNSAGKTLTAFAVGIAQSEGYLNISDTTSHIIGSGWTSLSPAQEEKITVRHQLTMTSGLDDSSNSDCTDPACLTYLAEPGTRWAYHNGPYTLLDTVIESATGMTLNSWIDQQVEAQTGITGQYIPIGYNNVYFSNARSMARFGLLLLAEGNWNGTDLLNDPAYFYDMTHSSQNLNNSYGYLTWLNGQSSFMVPQSQFVFPGSAMPAAPDDTYCALGKNAQFINVVPSQNLVLIRMGDASGTSLVEITYNDTIWQYMNRLQCTLNLSETAGHDQYIYPNPSSTGKFLLSGDLKAAEVEVIDATGKTVPFSLIHDELTIKTLPGVYFLMETYTGAIHKLVVE